MRDKKGNRQFGLCLNIYLKLFPLRTPSQGKSRVWKEEDTGHCSAPSSHVLSRRLDVSQQSCPVMVWHFVLPCDKMLTCWRRFRNNPEQRNPLRDGTVSREWECPITNFSFCSRQFSYILSSEEKINGADDVCQSCWSARRAWMMTLKVIVGESKDSQRGPCPPISDGAPPSSFHSSTDGLKTEEQWRQLHERGGRPATFANRHLIRSHLRSGLQISKWNDFFVDKKLDGLLLPVFHVAVQFVRVHSCRGRMTSVISCSYRGKDSSGEQRFGRDALTCS